MDYSFNFWSFIGGLISGGLAGSLITLKLSKTLSVKGDGNAVDQSRAQSSGDIVGRDKR